MQGLVVVTGWLIFLIVLAVVALLSWRSWRRREQRNRARVEEWLAEHPMLASGGVPGATSATADRSRRAVHRPMHDRVLARIMKEGVMKKPIRCMLGRHHYVWKSNPDGGRYKQCMRCGNDEYRGGSQSGAGITGGFLSGAGGGGF